MNQKTSIAKNVFSNIGGYIVSVVAAFLIAPVTIHALGNTRYGAWSLVSELIGYYGLLDLGIRGAVSYHLAKYAALNQQNQIKETLSSAFWLLSALGLLALLAGVGFTIGFPYLFKSKGYDIAEAQQSLLIMSGLIALTLPMNAFSGALVGKQRFDIASGIEVVNRVLTALMVYVAMKIGGGLVALALVQVAGRVVSWSLSLFACRSVLGGIFIRPKWFRVGQVRVLLAYGCCNAVGQVALLIIYRMDLLVVGVFAGIERVIFYSIASTLVSYASTLCANIAHAFTPRFTQLDSSNSSTELEKLFFSGTRLTGMVVTGMVAGILVFGNDFIRLWLGRSYVSGPWTDRSDIIMAVLMIANLPRMLQNISWQRLFGTGKVKFLMWLNICEAIANLMLSILLARRYGPLGVALGTFFPLMVSQALIMPIYSSQEFNMPYWQLIRRGLAMPVVIGLLMAGFNFVCISIMPPVTWLLLFVDVLVAVVFGVVLCVGIGLSRQERQELLGRCTIIFPAKT